MLKEKAPCTCLSIIMIDSVIKANKKYHPQTFLEECKYIEKKIKIENFINEDLENSESYTIRSLLKNYFIYYSLTLLLLDIFVSDILSIFASFLQTYYDIYFFHILSFSFHLLKISFYVYFLLTLLVFLYHFHSNLLLYLAFFLCFFDNKLYFPFFI